MQKFRRRTVLIIRGAIGLLAVGTLLAGTAGAQYEESYQPQDYAGAYASHVASQIATARSSSSVRMAILSERSEELLDEVGIRSDAALMKLPGALRNSFSRQSLPLPASLQRLNEFDETLAQDVYKIREQIDDDLARMTGLQDSLEYNLKSPQAVVALVDELKRNIDTNLNLWTTRIDVIRQRLIRDGTPDQARRMFVREYNTIALHYQTGGYDLALARLDVLTQPYGEFPYDEWLEGLPFYRAEALFALGRWDDAFKAYERTWQDQGNLYAPQAFLDWLELAFSSAKYRQIVSVWTSSPRLPDDVINRNRIRLLVAETYLRLDDPQAAFSALNAFEQELTFSEDEFALVDPVAMEQMQASNQRLALYSRLLKAEAEAFGAFAGAARPESGQTASASGGTPIGSSEADAALLGELSDALSGLGEAQAAAQSDSISRYGRIAYQVAAGEIVPERRDYSKLDRVISELESLVPDIQRVEREGPLFARVVMGLGEAYFEHGRYSDAIAAFSAVPISSSFYPEAQVSRAWAEMELGNGLGAMHSLSIARRWQLSPTLALEAAALNAYLLEDMGQIDQADDQLRRMIASVTLEERRSLSMDVATEIASMEARLRLVGVIALEKQQRALYQDAIGQRVQLDNLKRVNSDVERLLHRYASGKVDSLETIRTAMNSERRLLNSISRSAAELRRRAGDVRGIDLAADITYQQRQERLRSWLQGLRPEEMRKTDSVYQQWANYAEFAYAKQAFEENQRRKTRSDQLKDERSRISRLLQETP